MTEAGRRLIHSDGGEEEITHLDTDEIYRIVRDESPGQT
jgi:hypothetical protein